MPGSSSPKAHSTTPPLVVRAITPVKSALAAKPTVEPAMPCDRCGAETYRMHAVWRCPACGFKSDCCGW